MEDLGSIPGLGRSPGEGKGYPIQDSGLQNSKDCIVHGFAKSRTGLSDFHFICFKMLVILSYTNKALQSCLDVWAANRACCLVNFPEIDWAGSSPFD